MLGDLEDRPFHPGLGIFPRAPGHQLLRRDAGQLQQVHDQQEVGQQRLFLLLRQQGLGAPHGVAAGKSLGGDRQGRGPHGGGVHPLDRQHGVIEGMVVQGHRGELDQRAPRQDIGALAAGKVGQDQFDAVAVGLPDAGLDQQRGREIHRDSPLGEGGRREFRRLLHKLPKYVGR